jgi:alpha-galactosidase
MCADITDADWRFTNETKTNAEIVRDFYREIRNAAGKSLVLGCNNIGHIAAGLFEVQRIRDDTSGKMGVNTLAFRACQNNHLFAIDADCVGLTRQVPWRLNQQLLELLAFSGTPLFVSVAPDALGPEQRAALKTGFLQGSRDPNHS